MKEYATQTVETKSKQQLLQDINKVIRCIANQYMVHKKYDVGTDYDRNEFLEIVRIEKLLSSKNCDIKRHGADIKSLIKIKLAKYGL